MPELLQLLGGNFADQPFSIEDRAARHPRSYKCLCGKLVFFQSFRCGYCQAELGYLPDENRVAVVQPSPADPATWRADGRAEELQCCANRNSAAPCNWMLLAASSHSYCVSCRLTRTIPNLNDTVNRVYWRKIEDFQAALGGATRRHGAAGALQDQRRSRSRPDVRQRWPGKTGQRAKWIFCLTAANGPHDRRADQQTTPPEPQPGVQGEGGAGRPEGREDAGGAGPAV